MTEAASESKGTFAYQAQTIEGQPFRGTVDATDADEASRLLASMRVRVIQIEPLRREVKPKPLRGQDFQAFNQQLSQLTKAGLPVEHGLRLIAQDMRSGRLAQTVKQVAAELEMGTSLGDAFDKHRQNFPPLYGRLVAAGVQTSNLPGMLLNLGRHLDLVNRLRAAIWRTIAYPLLVLASMVIVIAFISHVVIPQFSGLYKNFGIQLPALTVFMLALPAYLNWIVAVAAVLFVGVPILWLVLCATGKDRWAIDLFVLPLPLIGAVLRRNLVARWCDAVRLGVQAGMDLPAAIEMAGDAVGSPALVRDGRRLIEAMQKGVPLDQVNNTRLLPPTVAAAMALASEQHDLATMLQTLSDMYQQQAETRLGLIPGTLTPILIIALAVLIGVIVLAMFLPFIRLIGSIMG